MNSTQLIQYEIHVVLVRTLYPLNIGSVSRAMSNMGAHQLHLIQPQCAINLSAQQMAANGQEGLTLRKEYSSWEQFLELNPSGIRIALSARDGRARSLYDLKDCLQFVKKLPEVTRSNLNKIYLFFGPEDCGLSGAEIDLAHYTCSLPTFGNNWSLNLAQAVLLTLYILRDSWGGQRTTLDSLTNTNIKSSKSTLAPAHPIPSSEVKTTKSKSPDEILYEWIETLGFDLSKRRVNAFTVMKRILLHNIPTSKELRIFEVVLQQTIRKLKEHKQFQIREKQE